MLKPQVLQLSRYIFLEKNRFWKANPLLSIGINLLLILLLSIIKEKKSLPL
jgi:hypothetical protein